MQTRSRSLPSKNSLKFFIAFIMLPQFLLADLNKNEVEKILNDKNLLACQFEKYYGSQFPLSPSLVYSKVKNSLPKNEFCKQKKASILSSLESQFLNNKTIIGINLNNSDINFANSSLKFYKNDSIFYSIRGSKRASSYNLTLNKERKDIVFDNSFYKYHKNNKIFTFGKISQWWGPSDEISLILSNQSDPLPLISIENNLPFQITNIGLINYRFFVSKLENDRHIPNAKLIGLRIELNRNNNIVVGLSRTAQFGGDGRPENLKTLTNIFLGRDNFGNSNSDEPGNQLAALDLKYINKNDVEYFFQIAGEDESGYLPSRTFYNVGFKSNLLKGKFTFDYANTMSSSGIKNYTYNHFLYKDGYRYKNNPLGASIDADSEIAIAAYKFFWGYDAYFSLKLFSGKLNINNSDKYYLDLDSSNIEGLSTEVTKKYKNYNFRLKYGYFETESNLSKNNIALSFEYSF